MLKNKNKALKILKKVYHYTNTDYDTTHLGEVGYKTDFLSKDQWQILEENNLKPNQFKTHTHNNLVSDFLKLKKNDKLSLEFAKALFIKGLTGEFPRFRQTLISYLYLQDISTHDYTPQKGYSNCEICGLPEKTIDDRTHNLFTYYLGHAWNEYPKHFVAELEDIMQYPIPEITEKDKDMLVLLLLFIEKANDNETPGQLEKRIGKEKLLPKTDKYKRYGILQTLAILEILPHKDTFDKQPARSDIVMPLAGWRGELKVDFKKAREIFNISIPNT
ncbi:hypothetical protein [Winogradskyella undariae]|uniref:hypothetical protein n=1 Tax=Winogradskyella undariae TaxID=1285465 RepID=UPI0015C92A15|nr:hypothetical protein [Winogradskyella undariae]